MTTETPTSSPSKDGNDLQTALVVWGTIANTSWRMFVPVLLFTFAGMGIDKLIQVRALWVFVGLGLGIVVAALLVVQQYKVVTRNAKKAKL